MNRSPIKRWLAVGSIALGAFAFMTTERPLLIGGTLALSTLAIFILRRKKQALRPWAALEL